MDAEFDAYAPGYNPGKRSLLKRLLGGFEYFVDAKVRWFLDDLRRRPAKNPAGRRIRLLDFGCGTGMFLRLLHRHGFDGELVGCDVSAGMLNEAGSRPAESFAFHHVKDATHLPFADGSFDAIVVSSVFHHIPPTERDTIVHELRRLLAPGGRLIVFEHNPANPLTRWMVSRAPEDRHAILLPPRETEDRLRRAGLGAVRTRHLLFFPPRLTCFAAFERLIGRIPMGGQYVVTVDAAVSSASR